MSAERRPGLAVAAAVGSYVAAQLVLRLLLGPALELDEAEAFYFSRELAWGYGPQPPLYFWLQWGLFRLLGEGLLALAALKALLLGGTLLAVHAVLRQEASAGAAAAGMLSLALLPQVVWESQRALTHSVLALFMTALALLAFLRAAETGRWRDHVALGVILGLGLLSKLNFALWAASALVAAAMLPGWRPRLRPVRLGLAGAVAAATAAPALMWMWRHPDLATGSVAKFEIAEAGGLWARLDGSASLLGAAAGFYLPGLLVLGGLALAARGQGGVQSPLVLRLMALAPLVALGLVWAGVLLTGTTEVRDRWLLPAGWSLVPAVAAALWPRLGITGRRLLWGAPAALWLLAVVALPYASLVSPGYRGMDWEPLAAQLAELGAPGRPVAVADTLVGGNLAFLAPELAPRPVASPDDLPAGDAILAARADEIDAWIGALGARVQDRFEIAIPRGDRATTIGLLVLSGRP